MRPLNADIVGVKRKGLAPLHAVPLKPLQKKLSHGGVAVVGVEDVDVFWPQSCPFVHPCRRAVGPHFDLVQIRLRGALLKIVLRVVENIDRGLLHIPSTLGGSKQIGGRSIDWPVAVPKPQRIQDITRVHVLFHRQLGNAIGGVEPPGPQETVAMLIDHKRGQVIVTATVFEAVLIVGEDINKIVAPVIAPRHCPLAGTSGVVVRILAAAAVAAFEIARGINHQTGIAQAIAHRMGS